MPSSAFLIDTPSPLVLIAPSSILISHLFSAFAATIYVERPKTQHLKTWSWTWVLASSSHLPMDPMMSTVHRPIDYPNVRPMDPSVPAQRLVHHTLATSMALRILGFVSPPFVVINLLNLILDFFQIKFTPHDPNSCPTSINVCWTLVPTNPSSHCPLRSRPEAASARRRYRQHFWPKF